MIFEIIKRTFNGIAWGGLVTFVALSILLLTHTETDTYTIWLYMGSSMILGIYFGISSFIFILEKWSPLKKILIHFFLSILFYFIIALSVGWVPMQFWPIIASCIFFIICYFLFWTGFNIYYRKLEKSLNHSLSKK